ncbi:MAG: S-methyl-5'-thioadenosine phosphorylase [Oligoflexia bacterium]|nr:S-methyl-5'-thioadenosine phosphorylase [Oligoflexia bacterium]MBF0364810.1 S-methyl-5'-thioadenosine phosphorylase [Oligoflexia bacterium]
MASKIALIGGSGIYKIDGVKLVTKHRVETPFGAPSSEVSEFCISDASGDHHFYFISRHGEGHTILPSEINYRANIFALKKLGVQHVVSVSAVGSLQEGVAPKMFVLPSQFIDWTKGGRKRSFFGEGVVGHVSVANPIGPKLQNLIGHVCEKVGVSYLQGGTYICIEGPQFSSKAESNIYRSFGATVIGMTNVPEAYLAKEAGIDYATIAMVTDYDCWKEEHCTLEEIMKVMDANKESVHKIVLQLIPDLNKSNLEFTPENTNAVMTHESKLSDTHKEIMKVILGG